MLAEISARAVQLRETTGRAAFDERVMAAMGRVPRHEFERLKFDRHGWSEHAPFDKVIVTAAPDLIPPPLIQQLRKAQQRRGNDQRDSAGAVFTT